MDRTTIFRAILDDPDDDALRLAYADWFAANGHAERAEWIRACCAIEDLPYPDDRYDAAWKREREAFKMCCPAWWESLTSISQKKGRGVFRFEPGRSATALKRLGKVAWLGQAFDEGWLERIDVDCCDDALSKVVAAWKEPAARIPLLVRPAPQINDEGLRRLLTLPQLCGLVLEQHVLRNPVANELATFSNIRNLTVHVPFSWDRAFDAVFAQIAAMPGLRRLHVKGAGDRPNDADLLSFRNLTNLKRLYFANANAVTDGAIEELRRALPSAIVIRK